MLRFSRKPLIIILLIAFLLFSGGCSGSFKEPHLGANPSAPPPTGDAAVSVCGVRNVKAAQGISSPPLTHPTTTVVPAGGGGQLAVAGKALYVERATLSNGSAFPPQGTTTVRSYTLPGGTPAGSPITVPFYDGLSTSPSTAFAVDGSGDVFLVNYVSSIVKLAASGAVLWSWTSPKPISAIFPWHDGRGRFVIGVIQRGSPNITIVNEEAKATPTGLAIMGREFTPGPSGGLIATDGTYVYTYDSAGRLISQFGDAHSSSTTPEPTGGPFRFYLQGGAAELDGRLYIADSGAGLVAASPTGAYQGIIPDSTLGQLTASSSMMAADGRLYFVNGGAYPDKPAVVSVSQEALRTLLSNPLTNAGPPPASPVLGFGAGIEATTDGISVMPGNYFSAGQKPSVSAVFDRWWKGRDDRLALSYSVRSWSQVLRQQTAPATTVPLRQAVSGASGQLLIPLVLPAASSGTYEVNADIVSGSTSVSSTCLHYSVGASGDGLDLNPLPAGADGGGPAPARAVALAAQIGTGGTRATINWSTSLPNCSSSSPTTAQCGPTALVFPPMDNDPLLRGAQEAAQAHVAYWVQVGSQGLAATVLDPTGGDHYDQGWWSKDVAAIVAHYKGVITVWEAWNEPDNNTFSSLSDYVQHALRPFHEAVKAVDASNVVIGGSLISAEAASWSQIISAGGMNYMDIVGIHPYTGNNRSWEEEGTFKKLVDLQSLLRTHETMPKPMWITELGWWSDGTGDLYPQGDTVARAWLSMQALGIPVWNYFDIEGNAAAQGTVDFSLIDSGIQKDDYVKPAALALMTATSQTRGRGFTGKVDTGVPHGDELRFGAKPGGNDQLVALWTDGIRAPAALTTSSSAPISVTITDEMGAVATATASVDHPIPITLSGSPQYVSAPLSAPVAVGPAEPFGPDLALSSAGAKASASSELGDSNGASQVIGGSADARGGGDLSSTPAWASSSTTQDRHPVLTVMLGSTESIDRILVTTGSPGSVVPSLRSYTVQVAVGDSWITVATQSDEFFDRTELFRFPPRPVRAVRVLVSAVNYGGYLGGAPPPFEHPGVGDSAVVYALEAYAPALVRQ